MAVPDGMRNSAPKVEEEVIPALTNVAPVIFVPCETDYTAPPPPIPSDPREQLHQRLAYISEHAQAVQGNFVYVIEREVKRVRQHRKQARDCYDQEGSPVSPRKSPSMREYWQDRYLPGDEREWERSYVSIPPRGPWEVQPNITHYDLVEAQTNQYGMPPRRLATAEVLNMVKKGMGQLDGYVAHTNEIKEAIRIDYAREAAMYDARRIADSYGCGGGDRMDIDRGARRSFDGNRMDLD